LIVSFDGKRNFPPCEAIKGLATRTAGRGMTMKRQYAVTHAPGYFRDRTWVYSTHRTAEAAKKAARKSRYHDPGYGGRQPLIAVYRAEGFRKGDPIYSDCYPKAV